VKGFIKKAVNFISNAKAWLVAVVISLWAFVNSLPAFATGGGGDIGSSVLATGTEKLVEDVTAWLLIVAPLVTVVAVIYYLIRKTVADEMDHKKWNTRITTAVICCIGVVAASLIINVIVGYYQ
jgi:hypothetical protein